MLLGFCSKPIGRTLYFAWPINFGTTDAIIPILPYTNCFACYVLCELSISLHRQKMPGYFACSVYEPLISTCVCV
jgi:hypothetical protein